MPPSEILRKHVAEKNGVPTDFGVVTVSATPPRFTSLENYFGVCVLLRPTHQPKQSAGMKTPSMPRCDHAGACLSCSLPPLKDILPFVSQHSAARTKCRPTCVYLQLFVFLALIGLPTHPEYIDSVHTHERVWLQRVSAGVCRSDQAMYRKPKQGLK